MTFLTAKPLARRTVLRGLGATMALPVLDAMTPAFVRAAAKPVHRFQTFYVPNGMAMDRFRGGADECRRHRVQHRQRHRCAQAAKNGSPRQRFRSQECHEDPRIRNVGLFTIPRINDDHR